MIKGCYQFKIGHYDYKVFYVGLMGTTKQKAVLETQKTNVKKIEAYHQRKSIFNHQKTAREEERKKVSIKQPETINKTAGVSFYLSVITLNVNRLHFLIQRQNVQID